MTISLYLNGQNCQQVLYNKEDVFEKFIVNNASTIFGENSIYIDLKHKIENTSFGGTIPDGILIDLSDLENPEFYLVEVELQQHDFFKHIFPQITKFSAFYNKPTEQQRLTEKIFSIIKQDDGLKDKLKKTIGTKEIYKFLKDAMEGSQNILIIIDGQKSEFEEIMATYVDTWGKIVKVQIINHFKSENQNIITAEPPFQNLEFEDATTQVIKTVDNTSYTEDFHLKGYNENIKNIYYKIKDTFLKINNNIKFNPTKSYIGVFIKNQFAYIQFYKKKLRIIIFLHENEAKKMVHFPNHTIRSHSESSQRYWGGGNNPNCSLEITTLDNFDEVESLLQKVVEHNEEQ